MSKNTKRKIIIEVDDVAFTVAFEGEFSLGEAYAVFLGCLEETEIQMEKFSPLGIDNPASGVLH
jgi:hypothetical protein